MKNVDWKNVIEETREMEKRAVREFIAIVVILAIMISLLYVFIQVSTAPDFSAPGYDLAFIGQAEYEETIGALENEN